MLPRDSKGRFLPRNIYDPVTGEHLGNLAEFQDVPRVREFVCDGESTGPINPAALPPGCYELPPKAAEPEWIKLLDAQAKNTRPSPPFKDWPPFLPVPAAEDGHRNCRIAIIVLSAILGSLLTLIIMGTLHV